MFRTAVGTIASQNVARGVFTPDEYENPSPSLERELGGGGGYTVARIGPQRSTFFFSFCGG